jgi:hypothetical protein
MQNYTLAIIAIVAALALLGVVVITVTVTIPLQQEAEARGCTNAGPGTTPTFGPGVNASKGRCIKS